jgi:hypothetical protein
MASIRAFLKPTDDVFDDMATRAMGEAFDVARKRVDGAGRFVYKVIAAQIIAAAQRGERDPVRLYHAGMVGLARQSE